ncbi:MAG: tetratricopeptide repeat protein, partial [Elusimicrobia bacterium]|nr:tetratricopeptide repeat protein [Elusimicrobiota bacterium]
MGGAARAGAAAGSLALAAALWWTSGAVDLGRAPALDGARASRLWDEAVAARAAGRTAASLSAVERLLASFPNEPRYLELEAQELENAGRFRDAARSWELYLRTAPFPTEACATLGRDYARAGLPERQIDADRRCLALDPSKTDQMVTLGLALERADRDREAESLLREALARAPNDADAGVGLIRLLLKRGALAEARARSAGLLASQPDDTDVLLSAAQVARAAGDLPRARALLEKAIRASPGYEDLYRVLAGVESQQGDAA